MKAHEEFQVQTKTSLLEDKIRVLGTARDKVSVVNLTPNSSNTNGTVV